MSFVIDSRFLGLDWIPEELPAREEYVEKLVNKLKFHPNAIAICYYGGTGIGKTSIIKTAEKRSGLKFIYVNCYEYQTSVKVCNEIIRQFDGTRKLANGATKDDYFATLKDLLRNNPKAVIVLDEVDVLSKKTTLDRDHTEILYPLTDKHAPNLILISNSSDWDKNLDSRIKSRMNLQSELLPPYNAQEIYNILKQRINLALRAGTIDEETIFYISKRAAQISGDVRFAIKILSQSIANALDREENEISRNDVDLALGGVQNDDFRDRVSSLSRVQKEVLLVIALESRASRTTYEAGSVETRLLYDAVNNRLKKENLSSLSPRFLQDVFQKLEQFGFISRSSRSLGRGRGRTTTVYPKFDVKEIIDLFAVTGVTREDTRGYPGEGKDAHFEEDLHAKTMEKEPKKDLHAKTQVENELEAKTDSREKSNNTDEDEVDQLFGEIRNAIPEY